HVGREGDQLGCVFAHGRGLAVSPAIVDLHILSDCPARLLQGLRESRQASVPFRIVRGKRREHADAPYLLRPLPPRRERPRRYCGAEQRDEVAAVHWITSAARASNIAGTSMPSAFAVLRLMTSSNFVACSMGRSPGFAPARIFAT